MPAIAFNHLVGPVPLDVVISESHVSEIDITENPIETGANVNDHAYRMPNKVKLEIGAQNMVATWQALKALQRTRQPFTLVTGLDVYQNMLIRTLIADRDKDYSFVLKGSIELQEIIIVDTSYATADSSNQPATSSGKPGGTKSTKSAKPSASRSNNPVTADKASSTIQKGDASATVAPLTGKSPAATQNKSILKSIIGG